MQIKSMVNLYEFKGFPLHSAFCVWVLNIVKPVIPSRELTYPTLGKGKSSTQKCLGRGYVGSLEGISFFGES